MSRRGSVSLELVLASLGYALLIVLFVALFDASRVRLEAEAQRHAMDIGIGLASSLLVEVQAHQLATALDENWPDAPDIELTGGCGMDFPKVGVDALDRSLKSIGVQVDGASGDSSLGSGLSVSETLCAGAGSMSITETGGPLSVIAPSWPESRGSDLLDPIFGS
jgi:hypothetical protein